MNKDIRISLAWAGGIIVLALAASFARQQGLLDNETVQRIVIGAIGLMTAHYGNRLPKAVAPSAHAQKLTRVAGWSLALSGLVYAGLWAFAPIPTAVVWGSATVLTGMAITFGYAIWLRTRPGWPS